jgi:hypothetical protein
MTTKWIPKTWVSSFLHLCSAFRPGRLFISSLPSQRKKSSTQSRKPQTILSKIPNFTMEKVTSTTQRFSRKVGDAIQEGTDRSSHVHAKNLFDVQGRVALVTGKYGAVSLRDISDLRAPRRRFWHRFDGHPGPGNAWGQSIHRRP